jgi:1,4-dihydroxy-2-naphthoate octaprenyltransferase
LGIATSLISLVVGLWFTWVVGWGFLPFLLVGAFFITGYTDALARIGIGEVAAGLGLGGMAVSGTAFVQAGNMGSLAVWASVPAFLMTFNLLLLNEFPDEEADREGGRKNLVLLLGRPGAARVYAMAALLTPIWIVAGVLLNILPAWALLGALPSLFLVPPLRWAFGGPEEPVPLPAMGANVNWNLATNTLLGIGLFLAAFL